MASIHLLCVLVISALFGLALSSNVGKLPKSFKKCKRTDPQLNTCLKGAIQSAFPKLVAGIPSLGLFTIDPLRVQHLDINQGTGPVSINLTFTDLDISGLGSISVTEVKADWDHYSLNINATFSQPINLQGQYKINGKVLILPIQGNGKCNLTLTDVKAKIDIKGKELIKDGRTFMEIKDFILTFTTSRLYLDFENLFNGDKALGDNMNLFLNENWSDILKELQPAIEESLGAVFFQIANRIFLRVPFDDIVPK